MNGSAADTAFHVKAFIENHFPVYDLLNGTSSDLNFGNKQELLSRVNQVLITKARTTARMFNGSKEIEHVDGSKTVTAAAPPPYEGDDSDVDSGCLLDREQQVEFLGVLHPRLLREIGIMQARVRQIDFDLMRTAAIALHSGEANVDLP